MSWNVAGTIFLCMFASTAHAEELILPPNDGFITDPGDVIPIGEEEELERKMMQERKETGLAFVSVILPTLAGRDIAHLAWELRTKWGIEQSGSGILILIAREEGKTLIAPGKRHATFLTDTVLREIIEADILPMLRQRKYVAAIEQGTLALRQHLQGEFPEKKRNIPLSTKNISYRIVMLLLVFLVCYIGIQTKRRGTGSVRQRRR